MDKLQQIRLPIVKEFEEFKSLFDASLQSSNPLLSEVLTYIKQRNGKMMRPILTLLMAKLFGEINYSALHAALSLELLHTASLVHDDVVDESDKRRGQSSVNAIYNNKVSVLVGDYMLATSLKHSAMTGSIRIVDLVARLGQNLAEGEIIQLTNINASEFSEDASPASHLHLIQHIRRIAPAHRLLTAFPFRLLRDRMDTGISHHVQLPLCCFLAFSLAALPTLPLGRVSALLPGRAIRCRIPHAWVASASPLCTAL